MSPKAISVKYQSPYNLEVTFESGECKVFDLKPYLQYPIFQELKNETLCRQARIDHGVVIWNEEIDMDPDTLYLESLPAESTLQASNA